jgi:hypothetical protein
MKPSLFYSNHLDLLSMKQRQQLILYIKHAKEDDETIVYGY